jgi:hypothetical protein
MFTQNITVDQIIDALAAVLAPFVGSAQIVRGQVDRVAQPLVPCLVLTELFQVDLDVPYQNYTPPTTPIPALGTTTIIGPTRIDIQIDFYSDGAAELCRMVKSVIRSTYGFDKFPSNIKPLYTSDGIQSPMISAEQQYESRWTLTVSLQYNPSVDVPQDFASTLTPVVKLPADLT